MGQPVSSARYWSNPAFGPSDQSSQPPRARSDPLRVRSTREFDILHDATAGHLYAASDGYYRPCLRGPNVRHRGLVEVTFARCGRVVFVSPRFIKSFNKRKCDEPHHLDEHGLHPDYYASGGT